MSGSRRRLVLVLAFASTVGLGGACGGNDRREPDASRARVFALRPVLATPDPPCPVRSAAGDPVYPDVNGTGCFALGDPIADEGDVRTASYSYDLSTGPTVSVVLGTTGAANLDDYAAGHLGQRLALFVNDRVASAPVIQTTSFVGRVVINNLPKDEAEQLFKRLRKKA